MKLELKRFVDDGDTTLGAFFIDGVFFCFMVEDQQQPAETKVWGEQRIPSGTFEISLRKEGRFHNNYSKKYGVWHKGMLCVHNRPNWIIEKDGVKFQYVLIHIGNDDDDTAGCLLPNIAVNSRLMKGTESTTAYKKIYPVIVSALEAGDDVFITITDIEDGR